MYSLRDKFGAVVESDVDGPTLRRLWRDFGGLVIVRGLTLTARELVDFVSQFGQVETELDSSKRHFMVDNTPVMRIGTDGMLVKTLGGELAWHTDSVYRENPPVGSALYCKVTPPEGGETCFADTAAGFDKLPGTLQERLLTLECVASLRHHDMKVKRTNPDYPVPTEPTPVVRVPVALRHPKTGRIAVYGMNSGTLAVVPKGEELDTEDEHPSVREFRSLIPALTTPDLTVVWKWRPGDLAVWDNRCTMHAATGYDYDKYTREMWRVTIVTDY